MFRVSAALFLSLLAACAPAAIPERTFYDSFYTSSVNGQVSSYNGRNWLYETPAYELRYWLGVHQEGSAPGSIKVEVTAKQPVVIAWDESSYRYATGATSPITHEGVSYGYRPANTKLPAQTVLSDRIVPRRNLVYRGDEVTNAYYLLPREDVGKADIGLNLVINGESLEIRFDGNRD